MTPAESAFEALLAADKHNRGGVQSEVTIDEEDYEALVEELSFDEIIVAGGNGEKGGFRAHVRVSDFDEKPDKHEPIEHDGMSLRILEEVTKTNNAIYTIVAGDPVTHE